MGGSERPLGHIHVEIHHGHAAALEQQQLALEIIFERGMLDGRDVVLAEIRERAHGKVHPEGATELDGLTRRLHDHVLAAHAGGVGEPPLELEGLGRGEQRVAALDAVIVLDSRQQGRNGTPHLACMLGQNRAQVICARGLALGAREGAHLHPAGRMVVCGIGEQPERRADIVHQHARNLMPHLAVDLVIDLGHIGNRTGSERLQQVLAPERSALAHEQRPRHHAPGIIGRICDLDPTSLVAHALEHDARIGEHIGIRTQTPGHLQRIHH